jgi:Helix-turn-helix domain
VADRRTISDPTTLRALAHPKRWALVEALNLERTATATRCAELTGESVASCSYHLGMLAKYGLVEQVEQPGREKPWRLVDDGMRWSLDDVEPDTGPGGELAVETLSEVYIDVTAQQMKDYVRRSSREGPQWRPYAGTWGTVAHITADEAAELAHELEALVLRYKARALDPALRPSGSRPVRIFLSTWLPRPPEEVNP